MLKINFLASSIKKQKSNKIILILLIVGFVLRLILSVAIYSGDVNNHISWGEDIAKLGTTGVYERDFILRYKTMTPSYPPLMLYLFSISYKLYETVYSLSWRLNLAYRAFPSNFIHFLEDQDTLPAFLKIPAMLSDIGIAFVIYLFVNKLLKDKKRGVSLLVSSLVIFNPAFIYNSAYWGQVDSVPLFFVLLSFYLLLYTKKTILSPLILAAALISKQTSIIFIPLFALAYLKKYGWKSAFLNSFYSLVFFWLSFLPFHKTGNILLYPFRIYWNKIQTGSGSDYVTDHAFNFWSALTGLGKIHDSANFIFMPYRWWGYLAFFAVFLIVLYKLAKKKYEDKYVIMSCAIISLTVFLFLTRMHSRYILQAIPFLLILSLINRKFLAVFIFVSLFNVVNMYHNWWAPRIDLLVELISRTSFINAATLILIGIYFWILSIYLKNRNFDYEH